MSLSLSRACALALALGGATAGCSFAPSGPAGAGTPDGAIEPRPDADPLPPDAGQIDAGAGIPDAEVPQDGPAGCKEWTPRPTHFDPCRLPAPSAALDLDISGEYVYDTDRGTLKNPFGFEIDHASIELPGTPPVRVISVDGLRVENFTRLRAVGSRPLIVASWSEIVVQGTIDVSSNSVSGAGANTGTCNAAGTGGSNPNGAGGGGGGGFAGDGGGGGDGSSDGNEEGGDAGGAVGRPDTVRGGCPGARGGQGNGGDSSGVGGLGGGALQLTAQVRIDITGRLHAGGQGGAGANGPAGGRSGGGGGGSGGLLDLEAPDISFGSNAIVAANGGGGGEGTQGAPADEGDNGQISDAPAAGGTDGSDEGGDGGAGGAGGSRDGSDGNDGVRDGADESGGGGGGGSVGYIILTGAESVTPGAVLSPPAVKR